MRQLVYLISGEWTDNAPLFLGSIHEGHRAAFDQSLPLAPVEETAESAVIGGQGVWGDAPLRTMGEIARNVLGGADLLTGECGESG